MNKNFPKLKLAIFDFTDCEGCQLEILNLQEKIFDLDEKFDIQYWRLAGKNQTTENFSKDEMIFDLSLVEGIPMSEREIKELKKIRSISRYLFALGACAAIAGAPGILDENKRKKLTQYVYGPKYAPLAKECQPINHHVRVDGYIHGCPVLPETLLKFFSQLAVGRLMESEKHTVCKECKLAEQRCFLLNDRVCLGPITQGGCGALCIKNHYPCYGCYGLAPEAQVENLKKLVEDKKDKEILEVFLKKVT